METPTILVDPDSEGDIEEVVRQSPFPSESISNYKRSNAAYLRTTNRPTRRRINVKEPGAKSHKPLPSAPTTPSGGSSNGSELSPYSALTAVTSATSSRTDSLGSRRFNEAEEEDEMDEGVDFMDPGYDDLLVPKLEPCDDNQDMAEVDELNESVEQTSQRSLSAALTQTRKRRGRPRKHPKLSPASAAKLTKERTKTGCKTCRRRKKKCDEAKPNCINCQKNAIECEGYPERKIWKSGKETVNERTIATIRKGGKEGCQLTASTASVRRLSTSPIPTVKLPPIIVGIETVGDRIFFHHYLHRLSTKFTVEGEGDTAFRSLILPVAQNDIGLMHSILSLASKHIDYSSPYGRQLLSDHPEVDEKTLIDRSEYHHEEAVKEFNGKTLDGELASVYCQMLCRVLQTLSGTRPPGEHRIHLESYQKIWREAPPGRLDVAHNLFIHEFFHFHIYLDLILRLPDRNEDGSLVDVMPCDMPMPEFITDEMKATTTAVKPKAVRMLGVFDGLFQYIARITNIRNQIRDNLERNIAPFVDYRMLAEAESISVGIEAWQPVWGPDDHRDIAGQLNKCMVWIYLCRTINPPRIRGWVPDPRIVIAVDTGIELLGRIKPNDSSLTLLLAPTFVLGCAAFKSEQRAPIRAAIGVIEVYMEYKNTDLALEVLEEVWRFMDLKDEKSWDWQTVAHDMGLDFLAT